MDRCPNCGSSVRVGAKFCTTCGFRLPVQLSAPEDQPHARSPFDTTSTSYVASRWPAMGSPEPSEPNDHGSEEGPASEPVAEPAEILTSELADDVSPEAPESQPFTGWPAYGSESGSGAQWSGSQKSDTEAGPAETQSTGAKSVEDAIFAWSDESSEETQPQEPRFADESDELTPLTDALRDEQADSVTGESPETQPEQSGVSAEEALIVAEAELPLAGEPEESGIVDSEPEPVDESVDVAEISDLAELDGGPAYAKEFLASPLDKETQSYLAEDSPVERARRLVAELSELLPLLSAGPSPAAGLSGDVADALAATRSAGEAETAAFQSLRAAVATAQARPRDVDVMLDLVSRAEAIAAVFRAHDRYAAAIDTAIALLRGKQANEPEPRW